MESEIRSYNHRYLRLHDLGFTFGKGLIDRLEDRTSTLSRFDLIQRSKSLTNFILARLKKEMLSLP